MYKLIRLFNIRIKIKRYLLHDGSYELVGLLEKKKTYLNLPPKLLFRYDSARKYLRLGKRSLYSRQFTIPILKLTISNG